MTWTMFESLQLRSVYRRPGPPVHGDEQTDDLDAEPGPF
jgi:hypothetical protein